MSMGFSSVIVQQLSTCRVCVSRRKQHGKTKPAAPHAQLCNNVSEDVHCIFYKNHICAGLVCGRTRWRSRRRRGRHTSRACPATLTYGLLFRWLPARVSTHFSKCMPSQPSVQPGCCLANACLLIGLLDWMLQQTAGLGAPVALSRASDQAAPAQQACTFPRSR
jgi:hypothetical protein